MSSNARKNYHRRVPRFPRITVWGFTSARIDPRGIPGELPPVPAWDAARYRGTLRDTTGARGTPADARRYAHGYPWNFLRAPAPKMSNLRQCRNKVAQSRNLHDGYKCFARPPMLANVVSSILRSEDRIAEGIVFLSIDSIGLRQRVLHFRRYNLRPHRYRVYRISVGNYRDGMHPPISGTSRFPRVWCRATATSIRFRVAKSVGSTRYI